MPRVNHFYPYPATMGQVTCQPSTFKNAQSAFTNPSIHPAPPAPCLPSMYPGRGIPHNPRLPYFRSTLRDHNWSVAQPLFVPMESSDAVRYQQGRHYHHPACHVSFYNCCTHICRPVDHCQPQPKRPRMAVDNWLSATESGITKSGHRVASQVLKTKEKVSCGPLPSPPPLISTYQNAMDHKNSKAKCETPDAIINEPSKLDDGLTSVKRREILKSGYRSELMRKIESKRVANAVQMQHKKATPEPDKFDAVPPDSNLNGKSISPNGEHKDCDDSHDHCSWCKQSNRPDIKMKTCNIRPVEQQLEQHLPLEHCDEPFHHMATRENANKNCQTTLFKKPQQGRVIVQSGKPRVPKWRQSFYENAPRDDPNTQQGAIKRSQSFSITEQRPLGITARDYREGSGDLYGNKTMNYENSTYTAVSSQEDSETNTEASKHQYQDQRLNQFMPRPNGTIHPQLQYYPPPKGNVQRNRSKSCDDTQNCASNLQSSYYKVQSNTSSCKTQLQSEMQYERCLQNTPVKYGDVPTCSTSNVRLYQRSKSMFCERSQDSPTMQSNDVEVNFDASCKDNNTYNTRQTDKVGHYQSVTNENSRTSLNKLAYERQARRYQTAVIDQPQATVSVARPHQQPNIGIQRSNSDSSVPPFQKSQFLSSVRSHMPAHQDLNQMGGLTDDDLFRDQVQKPLPMARHKATDDRNVCQGVNVISSLGATSLSELQKRRTELSQDRTRLNNSIPNMSRVSNEKTAVQRSHNQEATGEPKRYQKKVSEATLQIPAPTASDVESQNHKVDISIPSGNHHSNNVKNRTLNNQAADTCQSRTLPPLPSGKDLDSVDEECGGYAIDHNALPRIVAVHSIVTEDEVLQKQSECESDLFSVSDKKYWNKLLHKLTSDVNEGGDGKSGKISQVNHSIIKNVKDVQEIMFRLENGPSKHDTQQKGLSEPNVLDNVKTWTLWEYLSSPSKDLTIEIKSPTEYVEYVEAEKKRPPVRRKLTVAELSEKILYTRERIKQETIPWKKKLLVSLEATFIKRLRKSEKETGEKADIFIINSKDKGECKEKKNGEKEKCNKQVRKKKDAAKCFT